MGLFRRRRSVTDEDAQLPAPSLDLAADGPPPVEFAGIARSSLHRADFSPYEFQTEEGVWVRLHDMSFVSLEYTPQERGLTLRFSNDFPWTPESAKSAPLAAFVFDSVQILQWEDDTTLSGTPNGYRGQTSLFEYAPERDLFCLTIDTSLAFRARPLHVTLGPSEPSTH